MSETLSIVILGFIVPIGALLFSYYGIGAILDNRRNKVKAHIASSPITEGVEKTIPPSISLEARKFIHEEIEKKRREALVHAILIQDRASGLGWLTKAVSFIELIVFAGLTYLLFAEPVELLQGVRTFGAFFGGWLAIKLLSSHKAWSDDFAGKAYYYISLFGTLLNAISGLVAGLSIYSALNL